MLYFLNAHKAIFHEWKLLPRKRNLCLMSYEISNRREDQFWDRNSAIRKKKFKKYLERPKGTHSSATCPIEIQTVSLERWKKHTCSV